MTGRKEEDRAHAGPRGDVACKCHGLGQRDRCRESPSTHHPQKTRQDKELGGTHALTQHLPQEDRHSSENLQRTRAAAMRPVLTAPLAQLVHQVPYRLSKAELSWAPSGLWG